MILNKEKECMSREQIKALQSEKLVWQVKRMYEKVDLFRKRMDEKGLKPSDIKGVEDLSKLPFSYKNDLRDYYPYGLFAVPMSETDLSDLTRSRSPPRVPSCRHRGYTRRQQRPACRCAGSCRRSAAPSCRQAPGPCR